MKTVLTAAAFTLTLGLSSLAHAGFNDQGPTLDTRSTSSGMRQDLSYVPTVNGFNQQSHPATAVSSSLHGGHDRMALGANCDLNPRIGFQNRGSVANC